MDSSADMQEEAIQEENSLQISSTRREKTIQ